MAFGTKLVLVLSTGAALLLGTTLSARAWPGILPLTIASFFATAAVALVSKTAAAGLVLFFTFLTPALLLIVRGDYFVSAEVIWMAALLGAILPRSARSAWAMAMPWKVPIVLWGLTLACVWPVVVLRELDFTPSLITMTQVPSSGARVNPPAAINWMCGVVAAHGVGILWFDWLFLTYGANEERFRRTLLVPLAASWAIAVVVGIYQMVGDIVFLNNGLFASLDRASGTMHDANPFGVVAAIGGPALVAAVALSQSRWHRLLGAGAMVMSWLGMWASAGRTALAAGLIASSFVLRGWWAESKGTPWPRGRQATLGLLAVVVPLGFVLALAFSSSGPLPRIRSTLPGWSIASMSSFLAAMWNRDGYGAVASHLIGQFPFFGVGVGSFHLLVPDYSTTLIHRALPADNAQNWFRHQLVEFGFIGSIGWMLWTGLFGWFVLFVRPARSCLATSAVKGILVALAAVSLVGMPTQNTAVAITFWTVAFWYILLVGPPHEAARNTAGLGAARWTAVWAIVALAAGGTAYTARHDLRVPRRAALIGWPYSYGFSDLRPTVGLAQRSIAWTGRHAVAVLAPTSRWVKLTMEVEAINTAKGPVAVKVLCDDEPVLMTAVENEKPIVRYVRMRDRATRLLLEIWIDRTVRLSDYGLGDGIERGVHIEWEFIEAPPPG